MPPGSETIGRIADGRRGRRTLIPLVASALVLGASVLVSLSAGARWIPVTTTLPAICGQVFPGLGLELPEGWSIIWQHRVPRVVLAAVVGAALAITGVTVQTIVRNPLGDPYLLGVSSGACFGAVLLLFFRPQQFQGPSLFFAAFAGGLFTSLVVYGLARQRGTIVPQQLILAGIAATYLLAAATSFFLLQLDRQNFGGSNNFLFWSMGSFARAHWRDLPIPIITLTVGLAILLLNGRVLDLMNLNDESVAAMGLHPGAVRARLFVVTSLLVASSVAAAGQVGFVGLVIPHVTRAFCGVAHRRNLCCGALMGAAFLVTADTLSRVVVRPQEIPVGVLTAGCGAPFFIALLRRGWRGVT